MDDVTKAIRNAQVRKVGSVLLRDGLHKVAPAEPDDTDEQLSDKQAAKKATRAAAQATLSVPHGQATADDHNNAKAAHTAAADAHAKAAASSTKPEDVVMHAATASYHRQAADEHGQAATASPGAKE